MRIVKRIAAVLALLLLAAGVGLAQECKRDIEPQGGFSLCVPDGWSVETKENQKFKMLFAPAAETFTANINMKDDDSSQALTGYVDASIKEILSNPPAISATSIKLVGRTDFATASGLTGERVAFETEYKGLLIRTIQYYLDDGNNHKFIVTGTCLVKDKDTFDSVFERAAKSFRVDK